jgi:hypothetical protein
MASMRCPNCGRENADTSAFCFECGARLKADVHTAGGGQAPTTLTGGSPPPTTPGIRPAPSPPAPSAGSPGGPAPAPAPPGAVAEPSLPEVLRPGSPRSAGTVLTHLGEVFGLGYGPDYYAVWDLRRAGEPVIRFDTSPIGWEAAWRRFHELEREHGTPAWRRSTIGWILLHVAIGLIALTFVQLFLIGFVLGIVGKSVDELTNATGWGVALVAFTGLTAWLLFVFLRKPAGVRWGAFLGLLGAGFAADLILALATQPS